MPIHGASLAFIGTQSDKMIKNYDQDAIDVVYDTKSNMFKSKTTSQCIIKLKGLCDTCDTYHMISPNEYYIECSICRIRVPLSNSFLQNSIHTAPIAQNKFTLDHMYVELDSSIYNDNKLTDLMRSALQGGETPLADFFCRVNSDFKYCDRKWYYCVDNMWKITDDNCILGRHMMKVLKEQLSKIIVHYSLTHSDDLFIKIEKVLKYLGKTSTQSELPDACKYKLQDEKIANLLNSKHNLLPFKNGVCEFLEDSYVFRPIEKGDYIQWYLDYDYNPNVDTTKFDNMLSTIIRNTDVREYMLQQFSKMLDGNVSDNVMYILTGDGSNGKSILMHLMAKTFGSFSKKLHISTLTSDTDVQNIDNLRMVYFSEPRPGDKLKGSMVKELTKTQGAKMFLTCESVPESNESLYILRRLHIVHFDSEFVDEPNPNKSNEFKLDPNLPSKIENDDDYSNGFIKRLIEYYYKPKIPVPKPILDRAEYYRDSSNALYTWLKTNVIRGDKMHILTKDLKECYEESIEGRIERRQLVHAMEIFLECNFSDIKTTQNRFMVKGSRVCGWKGVGLRDSEFLEFIRNYRGVIVD